MYACVYVYVRVCECMPHVCMFNEARGGTGSTRDKLQFVSHQMGSRTKLRSSVREVRFFNCSATSLAPVIFDLIHDSVGQNLLWNNMGSLSCSGLGETQKIILSSSYTYIALCWSAVVSWSKAVFLVHLLQLYSYGHPHRNTEQGFKNKKYVHSSAQGVTYILYYSLNKMS